MRIGDAMGMVPPTIQLPTMSPYQQGAGESARSSPCAVPAERPRALTIGQELRIVAATYVLELATRLIPDPNLKSQATDLWLGVASIGMTDPEVAAATRRKVS